MESRQKSTRWTVWIGSVAVALLLIGGTAALADGTCYACTSMCAQMGVTSGFGYKDANGNTVFVGGTGWANCSPGTACFAAVQARCDQMCSDCLANGGGGSGNPPVLDCGDATCSIPTGFANDDAHTPTSVCSNMCVCSGTASFCTDTQIQGGGYISVQNCVCKCPN